MKLFLTLIAFAASLAAQSSLPLDSMDAYISRAMIVWGVPGASVAIVKNDSMVFAKGYGVKRIGTKDSVNSQTSFAIASLTKSMTASCLAILVDEGKMKWDDPVQKYVPEFQLYDAYVTREMTIRDLLNHRSGLETFSGDLLWWGTSYDSKEVLRRARYLKPKSSFRSKYGYQNIMYMTAGLVIEKVSGMSWHEFIRTRIFLPIGMNSTVTKFSDIATLSNKATPHSKLGKNLFVVDYRNWDNIAAAGSTISNVEDMAKYIRLQLGHGAFKGQRIFSEKVQYEMWSPQTLVQISQFGLQFNPTRHFNTYGFGWGMIDYRGKKILMHSGGYDGMISQMVLVPEDNFGFVILTNSISSMASSLIFGLIDRSMGIYDRDWSAEILKLSKSAEEKEILEEKKADSLRVKNTKPSLALEKYAGTYSGELYGDAIVVIEKNKMKIKLVPTASLTGTLTHWHYDTFKIELDDKNLPSGTVQFLLSPKGEIDEMKIDIPNPDFDFLELTFKKK